MNAPLAIARRDGSVEPIDLAPRDRRELAEEAALRGMSAAELARRVLERVIREDRFDLVLPREARR